MNKLVQEHKSEMNQRLLSNIYRHTGVDISDGVITQYEFDTLNQAADGDEGLLSCYLKRRISGEPLAYIIGYIEFDGLQIPIDKRAYITDPEAIYLVNHMKSVLETPDSLTVLEVGTGCGSLSFCIERVHPNHNYTAIDIDSDAIARARQSVNQIKSSIRFEVSDYFNRLRADYAPDIIFADPPWGNETSIYEEDRPASHYHAMPGISVWPFKSITGIHEQIIEEVQLRGWKCSLYMNFGMLNESDIKNAVHNAPECTFIHPADNITLVHITF